MRLRSVFAVLSALLTIAFIAPLATGATPRSPNVIFFLIDDWGWTDAACFFEDDRVELYNLKEDVGEKSDLASANPGKTAALRSKLAAWRTAVDAQLPTKNPEYNPARKWDSNSSAAAKAVPKRSP